MKIFGKNIDFEIILYFRYDVKFGEMLRMMVEMLVFILLLGLMVYVFNLMLENLGWVFIMWFIDCLILRKWFVFFRFKSIKINYCEG